MDDIQLACGPAKLSVAPSAGGSILSFTVEEREMLRPAGRLPGIDADLAGIILIPFSNRVGRRGFEWEGEHFSLPPNVDGESLPLHGDGWQRAWAVAEQSDTHVRLALHQGAIGPYAYCAEQEYRLTNTALVWTVRITNRARRRLPYGCGFHPWFPRDAHSRLEFSAAHMWVNDEEHLSTHCVELSDAKAWDFRTPGLLPAGLINNGFTGCDGAAKLHQGRDYPSVRMTFSSGLDTVILFSPGEAADFLCFEPVSHPINAHHLPGRPGLAPLDPGASMTAWMQIKWVD